MAKNYIQPGKVIDYKNMGTDVIYSGNVVVMGDIIGIALAEIAPNVTGAVQIEEVWKLPKKNSIAMAVGDKAYWNIADKVIVNAAGAGVVSAGRIVAPAEASATQAVVKINI